MSLIRSLIIIFIALECTSCKREQDPFQECFGLPRPAFLVRGEQKVIGSTDYLNFRYNGKFMGCAGDFPQLCGLLKLSKANQGDDFFMHPPNGDDDWWDAPDYTEQMKEKVKDISVFYIEGFEDPNKEMGTIGRAYNGNIYLTKVGLSSNKWGVKSRHVVDKNIETR